MKQLADKEHFDCLYRGFDFTYVLKSGDRRAFPYPTVDSNSLPVAGLLFPFLRNKSKT